MHLGYIGFGSLGAAVAERLVKEGNELIIWNRTTLKAEQYSLKMNIEGFENKVTLVNSPHEVVENTEICFLNLFDSKAVKAVLTAENGILSADLTGKIIADITTNDFREIPEFYDIVQAKGGKYVECPVAGSVVPALKGLLVSLVSADAESFAKVKPIIEQYSKHVFFLEKPTLATKMKLINNDALGTIMAVIAETVALSEKVGIPRDQALEILSVGGANSGVMNAKKDKLASDNFETHFACKTIFKDLNFVQALAYELGQPAFLGSLTKEMYAQTLLQGLSDADFAAIYKIL